jgi:hypothetical protein
MKTTRSKLCLSTAYFSSRVVKTTRSKFCLAVAWLLFMVTTTTLSTCLWTTGFDTESPRRLAPRFVFVPLGFLLEARLRLARSSVHGPRTASLFLLGSRQLPTPSFVLGPFGSSSESWQRPLSLASLVFRLPHNFFLSFRVHLSFVVGGSLSRGFLSNLFSFFLSFSFVCCFGLDFGLLGVQVLSTARPGQGGLCPP